MCVYLSQISRYRQVFNVSSSLIFISLPSNNFNKYLDDDDALSGKILQKIRQMSNQNSRSFKSRMGFRMKTWKQLSPHIDISYDGTCVDMSA